MLGLVLISLVSLLLVGAVAAVPTKDPGSVRDLDALEPKFRAKVVAFLAEAKAAGTELKVLETRRTVERQAWLYAQGRTREGNIVTWTMSSRHITGEAVDLWPARLGFSDLDVKAAKATLAGLRSLANKHGLSNPVPNDEGHFQWA